MRFQLALALSSLLVLLLASCGADDPADRPVDVVATTPLVADLVRNVGGDRVSVEQVLAPNVEPHAYEPRPSDARELGEADLVVSSGGELDDWLGGLVESAGGDVPRLTLLDSARRREDDPHWWQDPRNGVRAVRAIRNALIDADPAGRAAYERRAAGYTARLRRLDREIASCIERVPRERRKLVTTHDALGYFADRYGLEVIGALIPSRSAQAQPSVGEVDELVRQIRRERVQAIFPERALDPKLERAVGEETGARTGRPLWADTLGERGSSGDTYLRALAFNADAIADGLSGGSVRCTSPADGSAAGD